MNDFEDGFVEWLSAGIKAGYCSHPVCNTHQGPPMSAEEDKAWEDGCDPCVLIVRIYDEPGMRDLVERIPESSGEGEATEGGSRG